jgi:hypothetical protein
MSDETAEPGLSAFIRAIALAVPNAGRLDRDALLFAAGRAAGARQSRLWQLSSAALALMCVGFATTLALRPSGMRDFQPVVDRSSTAAPGISPLPSRMPDSPSPRPIENSPDAEWIEGMRLRERVLRDDVNSLPPVSLTWSGPPRQPLSERDVPGLSDLRPFSQP